MMHATEATAANTAVDVARHAVSLGASQVTMLYRRGESEMPAFPHEVSAAKREGVHLMTQVAPIEFLGEDRVTVVKCVRMRLGPPDA